MSKKYIESYVDEIEKVLEPIAIANFGDLLKVIGEFLIRYDLEFLGNLVKAEYEPTITAQGLSAECCYDEGNEQAGHIQLKTIFEFVEDILNTADDEYSFKFDNETVRLETDEEMEEESHSENVNWYTTDEEIDLKKLIGFTVD